MKRSLEFAARVKNKRLVYDDPEWVNQKLVETFKEDKPVLVKFSYETDNKTTRQNNYYHVLIDFFCKYLIGEGESFFTICAPNGLEYKEPINPESTKRFVKLATNVQRLESGEFVSVHCGTASKDEMSVMIESAINWIETEFKIKCPRPPEKNG